MVYRPTISLLLILTLPTITPIQASSEMWENLDKLYAYQRIYERGYTITQLSRKPILYNEFNCLLHEWHGILGVSANVIPERKKNIHFKLVGLVIWVAKLKHKISYHPHRTSEEI